MNEKKEVRKITLGLILSWIFGVLFIILGMAVISEGSYFIGILIILFSAMIIPYFNKVIAQKFNYEISGGIKFALVILILILIGFGMKNGITDTNKSSGTVTDKTTQLDNPKEGVVPNNTQVSKPKISCPDIVQTTTYEFKWGESIQGNKHLYLYADFLKNVRFTNSWELSNLPSSSEFSRDSFVCEKGSKSGESINKLYCRPTLSYEPRLRRNEIDSNGNIINTDYQYVKSFIFDISGKDINNAIDLKDLKFESITCSTSSW
ncbi:MAG TPA: hypothetical protein VJI52_01775 [Candidatus Nanoarchaeia archaeon]|nr:hypothetical protein [Candidatus Nanoarchaeia archaeon]